MLRKKRGKKNLFPKLNLLQVLLFLLFVSLWALRAVSKVSFENPGRRPSSQGKHRHERALPTLGGRGESGRRGRGGPGAKGAGAGPDSATDFPKPRSLPLRNRSLHTGLLSSSPAPGLSRPPGGSRAQGLPCGAHGAEGVGDATCTGWPLGRPRRRQERGGEVSDRGASSVLGFNPAKGAGGMDTGNHLFGWEGNRASFSECHVTDRQQRGGRGWGTKPSTGESL